MFLAHIGDLDGFMMDFDTSRTKLTIGFDWICTALFTEKPAMFFYECRLLGFR